MRFNENCYRHNKGKGVTRKHHQCPGQGFEKESGLK